MPTFDRLAPYVAEVDLTRHYTNFGPAHERQRHRLAEHFGLGEDIIELASLGTMALIGLISGRIGRATSERPLGDCPSCTFVATAIAAQACCFTPWNRG